MLEIETLHTFDTEYSADSVEWCQREEELFAVGTYQLEEKDENVSANNVRKGRIYLFRYKDEQLTMRQQIETDAILDQKWRGDELITATSSGNIQRYKLNDEKELEKVGQVELSAEESGNLALSIDVEKDSSRILASDSKGRISLIEGENLITKQWKAHDFEAWTCAFDRFNSNVVFSGKIIKFFQYK